MTPKLRRIAGAGRWKLAAAVVAGLATGLAGGSAEAQFYPGFGYGYGFFNYTPSSVDVINQNAMIRAQAAAVDQERAPVMPAIQDDYERVRASGVYDRYDVASRRGFEERASRPQAAPAPTEPALPLSTFYDKYSQLVWPTDAPTSGALAAKRTAADKATRAVLEEVNRKGYAPIATAAEARSKLLEYGQPALEYAREHTTERVADTFHLFLLSLYESLAQATKPPAAPKG